MPILSLQEIYPSTFHLTVYGDFQTVMYTEDTKFILKNTVTHPSYILPALKLVRITGNFSCTTSLRLAL